MKAISPALMGLSTAALVVTVTSATPTFALSGPEINQIAGQTSVHITVFDGEQNILGSGSGFIVAQDGDKYYIATNSHVTDGGQYFAVRMHDEEIIATDKATNFRGLDLAVVEIESGRDYPVATLAPSIEVGQDVFVSGWPPPHPSSNEVIRQFIYGRVSADLERPFNGGYEIAYSAPTDVGMSGGQVIDSSGRVVAIHGMGGPMHPGAIAQRIGADDINDPAVTTLAAATKSGLNYGIPVSTFINQAAANGIYLNLDVSHAETDPLSSPIANPRNADPTTTDKIEDVTESLSAVNDLLDTVDRGFGAICGIFGC